MKPPAFVTRISRVWAITVGVLFVAHTLAGAAPAAAQELEPRAYSSSPVGANFLGLGFVHSWGGLVLDPTVPVTNTDAKVEGVGLGYGRTFGLGRFQGLASASMPFAHGALSGTYAQTDTGITRSGLGDVRAKLSVNLIGGPALDRQAFARRPASSVVAGVSLTVSAPTGQYFPDKVINIGTNRWAFKPEAGVSYNWRRKWYAELYGGVWLFTPNSSYYPGAARREQDPLPSMQAHVSYTLARRTWAAVDGTWYWGGDTRVNGGSPSGRMDNKRLGVVVAVGLTDRQSLKLSYAFGASTRIGTNFSTVGLAYQLLWF